MVTRVPRGGSSTRRRIGARQWLLGALALGLAVPGHAQFQSDSTAFLDAVSKRDGTKVQELLDKNTTSTLILSRNSQGDTVLHVVAKRRDLVWLQFMLAKGAQIDARDRQGNTPLADAAQIGWVEGAQQLLDIGASVDLSNNRGETPLILATQAHDPDTVRALIMGGADPGIKDNVAGMSAHDYATRDGRSADILKLLDLAKPRPKKAISGPSIN
jgi:ankyrin repeat protein